jgi:threonine dehydrogenase-like Zn-dependent dehydrogenase
VREFVAIALPAFRGAEQSGLVAHMRVDDVIYKELTIRGVLSMSVDDTFRATDLIESGRYPFGKMHTHSFPIEQAEDAIQRWPAPCRA